MFEFKTSLRRLNIAQRFWAGICFFSLPIGVLLYFDIDQVTKQVEFARQELAGNQFQRPGVRLLKALGEYRVASLKARGGADPGAAKQKIERLFPQLEGVNKDLGAKLGFSSSALKSEGLESLTVVEIERKWESLKNDSRPAPDPYEKLIGDLRALIDRATDTSNLTLDPEMDSYHLSLVTSVTAPQSLNRIDSARVMIEPLLKSRRLPASARTASAIFSAMLKESDFDPIIDDIDTAFKENARSPRGASPTLRAAIEPAAARYKTDVQAFIDLLAASGQGKADTIEEFQQVSARASQSTLDLWEKTQTELDGVLGMRIDGLGKYRPEFLLGASIGLVLPLILMRFAVRGVTIPLTATVAHVDRVAGGDLSGKLPDGYLTRGDEIGTLARAMEKMTGALQGMIREIAGGIQTLAASSTELMATSSQMTSGSATHPAKRTPSRRRPSK